jgi:hypothetical protein
MKIELRKISIRDLVNGYEDKSIQEEGITGWNGKLDIRPKYQREFVYNDKQRKEVINPLANSFSNSLIPYISRYIL